MDNQPAFFPLLTQAIFQDHSDGDPAPHQLRMACSVYLSPV